MGAWLLCASPRTLVCMRCLLRCVEWQRLAHVVAGAHIPQSDHAAMAPRPPQDTMAMAYYQSDRFQSRHVRPDVSVDDEDKHLDHSRSEEVLRVRATHEPSETVFATKQTKPKLRGVRLGSFVCGCFGGDWVYDGMEGGSSLKSNSVRAPPTDSTSAASDGTPFDNADSLGSEPDVFEQHAVIGAELTAAHMQPLPSTGFADGMVPQQAYYQQSVFDVSAPAPTLLSHRSLQVCGRVLLLHHTNNIPWRRLVAQHPCSVLPPTRPAPATPAPPLRSSRGTRPSTATCPR